MASYSKMDEDTLLWQCLGHAYNYDAYDKYMDMLFVQVLFP